MHYPETVSATVSHNFSDIGTIEVDAYINTRRAQVDAIQTINSDELAALMHSWHQMCRRDKVSMIFTNYSTCSKISSAQWLFGLDRFT